MIVVLMLIVLIMGVASVSASDDLDDTVKATDETDDVISASEVEETTTASETTVVSNANDNDTMISANDDFTQGLTSSENGNSLISKNNDELMQSSEVGNYADLINDIGTITEGKTITLTKNYVLSDVTTNNAYLINVNNVNNVVIDGNGHTINAANKTASFIKFNNAKNCVIKNINFINFMGPGSSISYGSVVGIVNLNNFSMYNCNFSNLVRTSSSSAWGSAFFIGQNTFKVTLNYCNFINVKAQASGGFIYTLGHTADGIVSDINFLNCYFANASSTSSGRGGVIECNAKNAYFYNCVFENNSIPNGAGGAIGAYSTATDCTIEKCTFINNHAMNGGAINAETVGIIRMKVINCQFYNNTASNNGGAVVFNGDDGMITDCNFIGNNASYGGAFYSNAKNSVVDDCKFENNIALDGSNFYATEGNSIEIADCHFDLLYISNAGTGDGLKSQNPTNWTYAYKNIAEGGKIILTAGTYSSLVNIVVNKTMTIIGEGTVTINANNQGRIFTIEANNVNITSINFQNGKSTNGGAILWNGDYGVLSKCTFTSNSATNGGALYVAGNSLTSTSNTFTSNSATNGGGVYVQGNNAFIGSTTFKSNSASYGGAIYNAGNNLVISEYTYTSNSATAQGPNLYSTGTYTQAAKTYFPKLTVTVSDTIYGNNVAISGTLTDYYNGARIGLFINGNKVTDVTINNGAFSYTLTKPAAGSYTVTLGSSDNEGNAYSYTYTPKTFYVYHEDSFYALQKLINSASNTLTLQRNYNYYSAYDSKDGVVINKVLTLNGGSYTLDGKNAARLLKITTYDVSVSNIKLTNGYSDAEGGAIYWSGTGGKLSGATFTDNAANSYNNLYTVKDDLQITNSVFNKVTGSISVSQPSIYYGGNTVVSGSFDAGINLPISLSLLANTASLTSYTLNSGDTFSYTWNNPSAGKYNITLASADRLGNTYNYNYNPATFEVKRYDTNFAVTVSDYKVQQDVIISVDTGKADATGTVDILFNGKNNKVTLSGGKAQFNGGKVAAGTYQVSATYNGDSKYNNVQKGTSFTVTKYATTTNVVLTNVNVGNAVPVTVTVTSDAPFDVNGRLILIGAGGNKTVTITKGSGSIDVTDLPAGRYVVSGIFQENENFTKSEWTTGDANRLVVSKYATTTTVTIADKYVDEDVIITVTVNAPDNTIYPINGVVTLVSPRLGTYTVDIVGGTGTKNIGKKAANTNYLFTGTFAENDYFLNSVGDTSFNVNRYPTKLTLTVADTPVGQPVTINALVESTVTTATTLPINGVVNVNYAGNQYPITITNGQGSRTLENLPWSTGYSLVSVFSETANFTRAEANANFAVTRHTPTVTLNIPDVYSGTKTTVYATVTGVEGLAVNGEVTVNINQADHKITILNGRGNITIDTPFAAGKYVASGVFADNEYYTVASSEQANHEVKLYETTLTITTADVMVRDNFTLEFEVTSEGPYAIDGTVSLTGNFIETSVPITNGKGSISLSRVAGIYPYTAVFNANGYYDKSTASASVEVKKYDTRIEITMPNALVGDDAYLELTVISDLANANGTVFVTGPKGSNDVEITNGKGTFIIPNAAAGLYDVQAWFKENDDYKQSATVKQTGMVDRYNATVQISAADVLYGQNLIVKAKVTGVDKYSVNGTVVVIINGQEYNIAITNGEGQTSISDLAARNYVIGATFLENDYYNKNVSSTSANVLKHNSVMVLDIEPVMIGEDVVINFRVTGNESYAVNGIAHVTGSQGTFNTTIINGRGNVTVYNVKAGIYIISGVFDENDIYKSTTASGRVVVNKYATDLTLNADHILVGEDLIITATVGSLLDKVNGTVTVIGNLQNYTITVVNGTGSVTIHDLPASDYYITGVFNENDKYLKSNATVHIDVEKHTNTVIVTATPILVGEDLLINVEIQGDGKVNATGTVDVTINHQTYQVTLTDGVGQKIVSGLTAPLPTTEYVIGAIYTGDGYYLRNDTEIKTSVSKRATTTELTVVNFDNPGQPVQVGDTVRLYVKVIGDGYSAVPSGKVVINGKRNVYNVTLNATGEGYQDISGLAADDYFYVATYQEDANYNKSTDRKEFEVSKHDSSVVINVDNFKVGQNVTLSLTLSENAGGSVIVIVNGEEKNLTVTSGSASGTFSTINTAGKYDVSAVYSGDNYYLKSDAKKSFEVTQYRTSVLIEAPDLTELGKNVTINVTVSNLEDASLTPQGTVTIVVGGQRKEITLANGKAQWNVSGLTVGSKVISTNYNGNNKFATNASTLTISIGQHSGGASAEITAEVSDVKVGENVEINVHIADDATGNVTFIVNGEPTTKELVKGNTSLTLTDLTARDYIVSIAYDGDENYTGTGKEFKFTVSKWDINMTVSVENINVLSDANVSVNVIGEDGLKPTGTVTFAIAGTPYTINVVDGKGYKLVSGLAADDYKVEATFLTTPRYSEFTNETSFKVSKFTPTINVVVTPNKVLETAIVEVTLTGVNDTVIPTGTVSFSIGTTDYVIELDETGYGVKEITGLKADTYDITPIYESDANYTKVTADTVVFNVLKHDPTFTLNITDVYVGDKIKANVTVVGINGTVIPTGNVSVLINGVLKEFPLTNGNVIIEYDPIPADEYRVEVNYYGNDIYNKIATSTKVNVLKYAPEITIAVDNVKVLDYPVVNVTINGARGVASGKVQIAITGQSYTPDLVNGYVSQTFTDLPYGHYSVTITYTGDDNYTKLSQSKGFDVTRYTPVVDVTVKDINVTETAHIEVHVHGDAERTANAIVEIYVGNHTFYEQLDEGGKATVDVPDLPSRTYNVLAHFVGGPTYEEARGNATFDVIKYSPALQISVAPTNMVGDNVTFTVSVVSDGKVNATGEVEIYFPSIGRTEKVNLINGSIEFNVTGLGARHYLPTIVYKGDANYDRAESSAAFDVLKYNPEITVTTTEDTYMVGDEVIIDVSVTGGSSEIATGNITIVVDNKEYNITLDSEGKARQNITGLKARHYDIAVSYTGDYNYLEDTEGSEFWIIKYDPTIEIFVENQLVGPQTVITVNVTGDAKENASGKVHIYVAGQDQIVDVVNGTATWTVPNSIDSSLTEYVVEAVYDYDDNYNPGTAQKSFTISKWTPKVNITVSDIKVGEYAEITVNVTGDATDYETYATGVVEVLVNGVTEELTLTDGIATKTIKLTEARTYTVDATYLGDRYYDKLVEHKNFEVVKWTPTVNVTTETIKVGQKAIVKVNVTGLSEEEFAQGNVSIYINNKTYNANVYEALILNDGIVTFEIPQELNKSTYLVEVNYYGDTYYAHASGSANLDVEFWIPTIEVTTNGPIKVGEEAIITVNVTGQSGHAPVGHIILSLAGQVFTVNLTDGVGVQKVYGLNASTEGYIITAEYESGRYYDDAVDTHAHMVVTKSQATVTVNVEDIKVGEAAQVVIAVTGGANVDYASGNVSFVLNGKTYNEKLVDGTVTIPVADLAQGHYIVDVVYTGDRYYDQDGGHDDFDVNFNEITVSFEATDVKVNDNTTVTVTLSNKTDGIVTIDLDGVAYNITITDGVGTKSIKVTRDGTMYVSGWFIGNEKYAKSADNYTSFESTKRESQVNVFVEPAKLNTIATVSVQVTSGATGNVTVTVNGRNKTIILDAEGKGSTTFEGLEVGTYTVYADYNGDYQYLESENDTASLEIIRGDAVMDVVVPTSRVLVGDEAEITVTVQDATGEVTITVGDHTEVVTLENSQATIRVALGEGTYIAYIHYSGDSNYAENDIESDSFVVKYANATDLQKLIDEAIEKGETEINLTYDYKFTDDDEAILIDSPISINGNGHTIDADGSSTVFNVTGDDVKLGNLTVTGATGTAISVEANNITIEALDLNDNEGTGIEINGEGANVQNVTVTGGSGTAISITGANATVSEVSINNNTGDSIKVNGSGAKLDEITVSGSNGTAISLIGDNSTVTGVNLEGNEGTGIAVNGSGAKLDDIAVTGGNGTAIEVTGDNSTVSGVTIENNSGDGIAVNGSGAKLDDITVSGSNGTAVNVAGDNSTVSGVTLTGNEGTGIAVNGSGAKLDEISVSGSNGTAVAVTGDDTEIKGINLTDNTGDGIAVEGSGAKLDDISVSGSNGTAIAVTGDDTEINGVNLTGNEGTGIAVEGAGASLGNVTVSGGNGTAVAVSGDNTTVSGITIENNSGDGIAVNGSGAKLDDIAVTGSNGTAVNVAGDNSTVSGVNLTGNSGTGLAVNGSGAKLDDIAVTGGNGTAIAVTGDNSTVSGIELTDNEGTGLAVEGAGASLENVTVSGGSGTAIAVTGDNSTVSGISLEGTEGTGLAVNGSGAKLDDISVSGGNGTAIAVTGDNSTVSGISLEGTEGTGLAVNGSGAKLDDISVSGGNGTAIAVTGDDTEIKGVNLTGNEGTGIAVEGAGTSLGNVTVSGGNGTAVSVSGDNTTVSGISIENNAGTGIAVNGSGAKLDDIAVTGSNGTAVNVAGDNSTVSGINLTGNSGTGLAVEGAGASLENVTVSGGSGTAISVAGDNTTVSGVNLEGNTGTGMEVNGSGANIAGISVTGGNGTAMTVNGDNASIKDATFANNTGTENVGVVINGNGASVANTTFANNTGETGTGIVTNGNGTSIANSTFSGNNATRGGSAIVIGNNVTDTDFGDDITFENNTGENIERTPVMNVVMDENLTVGDALVVEVTVKDATGDVTITINNITQTQTLFEGKTTFTVSGITKGNHNVVVSYLGDGTYTGLTQTLTLVAKHATFKDLQELIDEAIANNVTQIDLPYDYEFGEGDEGSIEIPEGITINGNGHTIDAAGQSGIFNVTGDNVVLSNITLTNGNAEEGGAIVWNGANGTIENANLVNNSAENGGAILWNGDNATIKDSTFENNTASESGAGVILNGNNATVEDTEFTGNSALNGAGIVSNGNGTAISNATFEGNTAMESGAGAILNGNDATVANSTFTGNEAINGAGIVSNGNGTAISNATFEGNTAVESGAGVVLNGNDATVANSTFSNNNAETGAGVVSTGNGTTISGSEFTGNNATTGAGAVLNGDGATVEGSTFEGNSANEGAGVVSNGNGTSIKDTEFTNNVAEEGAGAVLNGNGASVDNATFTGNKADNGAGIVATGNNTQIVSSTFENNTAETGAGIVSEGTGTLVSDSNFTGNKAESGAGVVLNGDNATVTGSEFTGNEAVYGAGIVTTGNNTQIEDSKFANNTAETGAGVVSEGSNTTISGSEFTGNNATTGAGAVLNGANATVENATFAGNEAKEGAGIVSNGDGATIADTKFENNTAETGAGAVLNGNDANVANATFAGNNATTGAGVVSNGNGTSIANATFANNTATTGAGAVINGEGASVSNATFTGNNATAGSAIALGDNASDISISDDVVMENNTGAETAKNPTIVLEVPSLVKVGNDAIITVTVENAEGDVTFYVNGEAIETKKLVGHKATFTIVKPSKGNYDLKVVYSGESGQDSVIGTGLLQAIDEGYAPGFKDGLLVVKYSNFQDLQKLIDDAVAAGNTTIFLDYDYEFDIDNDTVPVYVVPSGITIDGQGHFVSGADASQIFNIVGNDVVLKNIVLTNAKGEEGGAIVWNGNNGTIENAVLANNTAETGGAILWTGDDANIVNSTFSSNNATTGAGVVIKGNGASIEDSTFTGNNATTGAGVVINGDNAKVDNTTFTDNEADEGAGIVTTGANTEVTGSTFTNNTALTGAGVLSYGNETKIVDTEFSENTALDGAGAVLNGNDAVVENATFTDNEAFNGAGIVINGNNTEIKDSTFENNIAEVGAGVLSNGGNTTIKDSEFTDNSADTGAGAVLNGDNATVEGSTFTGNDADEGAGVVSNGDNTKIADSKFEDNTADVGAGAVLNGNGASVDNSTFVGNDADEGAGVVANGNDTQIVSSTFENNTAMTGAGVVSYGDGTTVSDSNFTGNNASAGAGVVLNGDNATVSGSEFTGNNADYGAGVITTGENTKVEDSKFENNTAETGAGVLSEGTNTTISGSEFTGNNATTGAGAVLNGANATVEGSTFSGNNATEGAGIVSNGNGTSIKDTEFANNTAEQGAGAVLNGNDAAVENATFVGNEADNGAGIVATGDNAQIANSTFANNTAMTGAGIVSNGTGTSISGSEFTGNNANSGAGVMLNGDNATVENATFSGNQAVNGAGVVSNGEGTSIKDTEFTNNTAETGAGAILNGGNATVEGSTFAGNNATEGAGVVSNGEGTSIKDTEFANNTAETGAGAVLNGNGATVENATFAGNNATEGAGIVSNGNGTNVSGTTFANNTAETGAGMVINGANSTVGNSTFTGNNASDSGSAISVGGNATGTDIKEDNKAENNTAGGVEDNTVVTYTVDVKVQVNTTAVGDDLTVIVTVEGDENGVKFDGKVKVVVDGKEYIVDLTGKQAIVTIPGGIATAGKYNVTASYINDTAKLNPSSVTQEVEIYNNASITASDMTRGYNSGTDFEATLVDKYGNALANTNVQITVDGKVYTVKTDANGKAVLNVKLGVGKHTVVVKNPSDGSTVTKTVTIVATIQSNKNMNIFYLDGSTFKVRVFGADGKVVGAGQVVAFKINGKTYNVKTDKNGWATLKLNIKTLKPTKKYAVTATYNGYVVKNTVKVKQVIKAKKTTTVKKSKKVLKIKIKLKGKKVYKKKAIKVKFRGKTYKLKTNKKGVATLKIKQKVLKKLKAGKKYKYTITYQKAKLTRYIKVKK